MTLSELSPASYLTGGGAKKKKTSKKVMKRTSKKTAKRTAKKTAKKIVKKVMKGLKKGTKKSSKSKQSKSKGLKKGTNTRSKSKRKSKSKHKKTAKKSKHKRSKHKRKRNLVFGNSKEVQRQLNELHDLERDLIQRRLIEKSLRREQEQENYMNAKPIKRSSKRSSMSKLKSPIKLSSPSTALSKSMSKRFFTPVVTARLTEQDIENIEPEISSSPFEEIVSPFIETTYIETPVAAPALVNSPAEAAPAFPAADTYIDLGSMPMPMPTTNSRRRSSTIIPPPEYISPSLASLPPSYTNKTKWTPPPAYIADEDALEPTEVAEKEDLSYRI